MALAVKRNVDLDVAVPVECELGESPRWDPIGRRLLFVDVLQGRLHAATTDGDLIMTREVGQELGAVNRTVGDGLVLAMRDGIYLADATASAVRLLVPIESKVPTHRMNDAVCDQHGRLWAGTMALNSAPGVGSLYRVQSDGAVATVLTGLTISNGLGWSPDGSLMYFVDSPTRRIDVLDYDLATGTASNRRPLVRITDTPGMPDGLTVDIDGGIWVALWGGAQVRRYCPDGSVTDIIDLPVKQPTSCTFGGDTGDVLYITSARLGLAPHQLAENPLSGSVLACRPGYRGKPANAFDAV
jgi:sugar lactone lactonase YvrE